MDGVSATSNYNLQQAVLAQIESQDRMAMAVLARAQEVQQQQGSAAVQLIEAAGAVIDFRV